MPGSHQILDPDFLVIREVAAIFRSSVDTIRRIPKDDLPVYRGPGKFNMYLREDLKNYLRRRRIDTPLSDDFIDGVLQ